MGVLYLLFAVVVAISQGPPTGDAHDLWRLLNSTLSIISSGFLLGAWYMMKNERQIASGSENAMPTMSKPFVATLMLGINAAIAAYWGLARTLVASAEYLHKLFSVFDVSRACCCRAWVHGSQPREAGIDHVAVPLLVEGNRPFVDITFRRHDGSKRSASELDYANEKLYLAAP